MDIINSNNSESLCNSFESYISNKDKIEITKMNENIGSIDDTVERKSDDPTFEDNNSILKSLVRVSAQNTLKEKPHS